MKAVERLGLCRAPLPCELAMCQLFDAAALAGVTNVFNFMELQQRIAQASNAAYEIPFRDFDGKAPMATLVRSAGPR
jgi:hypothetical protein